MTHPYTFRSTTLVRMNEDTAHHPLTVSAATAAVRMRYESSGTAREGRIATSYVTHADHVPADQVEAHARELLRIRDNLIYEVRRSKTPGPSPSSRAIHPFGWLAIGGGIVVGLVGACLLVLWRPAWPVPSDAEVELELDGLGGWLLLLGFGVLTAPLLHIVATLKLARDSLGVGLLAPLLAHGQETWSPWLALLILTEAFVGIAGAFLAAGVAVLFLRRRRTFRFAVLALNWGLILFAVFDALAVSAVLKDEDVAPGHPTAVVIRSVIVTGLWSAYLMRSRRVRATFRR